MSPGLGECLELLGALKALVVGALRLLPATCDCPGAGVEQVAGLG